MYQKIKILFWLRRNRINHDGRCTLYSRVTSKGNRIYEASTGISLDPKKWNAKSQRASEHVVNHALSEIRNSLFISFALNLQGEEKKPTLEKVMKEYLSQRKEVSANNTYRSDKNKLGLYVTFLTKKNIKYYQISNVEAEKFKIMLRDQGYKSSTVNKVVQVVKTFYRYCGKQHIVDTNPFEFVKGGSTEGEDFIFLTNDELANLQGLQLGGTLREVRDMFVLQCYTGLSYIDLKKFKKEDILLSMDGYDWIINRRTKTKTEFYIPIFCQARIILSHYNYKLPVLSNQKYNGHLKRLAQVSGINKNISTKVGRTTAGTLLLNAGVRIEVVSKVLGHKNTNITQRRYAKILNKTIAVETRMVG